MPGVGQNRAVALLASPVAGNKFCLIILHFPVCLPSPPPPTPATPPTPVFNELDSRWVTRSNAKLDYVKLRTQPRFRSHDPLGMNDPTSTHLTKPRFRSRDPLCPISLKWPTALVEWKVTWFWKLQYYGLVL